MELGLINPPSLTAATTALCVLLGVTVPVATKVLNDRNAKRSLKLPPAVPGLPIIGNLHQLVEKKPYKAFVSWAETYGPVYSIKSGASNIVVVNSAKAAKEVFTSITDKALNTTLEAFCPPNKSMIALSDRNQFHKGAKRCIMMSILGAAAQRRHQKIRNEAIDNMINRLYAAIKKDPFKPVNFRDVFLPELFSLSLKQSIGEDVKSVYVEDLGEVISREEMLQILVTDPMLGALEVDWRDFFPYLKWVPNLSLQAPRLSMRKAAVTKALICDQKKRIASGKKIDCYLDFLLQEENAFSEEEIATLIWESIIETSDTTLVTNEWALYEIAKDHVSQETLYSEIKEACGIEKLNEEHFSKTPYLNAIFHEALRLHSPAPLIPMRYASKDTNIMGYDIPVGSKVMINLYACNMDENNWAEPEQWKPERFLSGEYNPMDLYKTFAFGGGKRVCAGSLQAMYIFCSTIGRFIQEFEWELAGEVENSTDTTYFTNTRLNPLIAYIKPRA